MRWHEHRQEVIMNINKIIIPAIMLIFIAVGATSASAQAKWTKLGEKVVNYTGDHDTITADDDDLRIRELKMSVENAPVRFLRVVVNYKDGVKEDLEFLEDVAIGKESRSLTVHGDGHPIKSIDFWYENASLGGKNARVIVYGRN